MQLWYVLDLLFWLVDELPRNPKINSYRYLLQTYKYSLKNKTNQFIAKPY